MTSQKYHIQNPKQTIKVTKLPMYNTENLILEITLFYNPVPNVSLSTCKCMYRVQLDQLPQRILKFTMIKNKKKVENL